GMKILKVTSEQASAFVEDIARIHVAAYSKAHFTSTFGHRKLSEYNKLLLKHSDISLVALDGGRVVGFIISGEAVSRGVAEFMRNNRLFLFGRLLAHPGFLTAKVYRTVKSRISPSESSSARYRLLSIATDAADQSRGVGRQMLA